MNIDKNAFALITGASSGIGQATARQLAALGKNLIIVARRKERLETLHHELEKNHNITVKTYSLDVSDLRAVEHFYNDIAKLDIDMLINNAGLSRGKEPFDDCKFKFYRWARSLRRRQRLRRHKKLCANGF